MKIESFFKYFNFYKKLHQCVSVSKPPWNVLFFGTDEFSIYSLETLYKEYTTGTLLKRLEVVTTVKQKANLVNKYAVQHKLAVHKWPIDIPDDTYHIGLVVSFGHMIPESVIKQFPLGMLNVHASLLPRWRGAAPIVYAIANGDSETGITIIQIKPHKFDVGDILLQKKIAISKDIQMPQLYEQLGKLGANCLLKCVENLPEILQQAKPQSTENVTLAPKITPEFGIIHWKTMKSNEIYNLERALTGLLSLTCFWNGIQVKLMNIQDCGASYIISDNELSSPGFVKYDKKDKLLKVLCANRTWISVKYIGVFGKKVMSATDFNNGFIKKEPIHKRTFS